ncbi:hypothetical protein ABXJ76_07910 [Methylobacter sp. G7]|uniref:hypothetical protein n=1 Tax=Methylobacter sp. G7 TaxID=3230117 RepID=UPI003D80992A
MSLDVATSRHFSDLLEELHSQICALHALSGLLNGCSSADSVEPSELTYLLDPIINTERALMEQMCVLIKEKKPALRAVAAREVNHDAH